MIGLARMASMLAEERATKKYPGQNLIGFTENGTQIAPRDIAEAGGEEWFPLSREYYRIIDRIARGEKP